ncbi:MAG: hypothetical protein KKD18_02210 [Nanoarchaeota archaeon]|nr:hypothetical protein [Nanoarchaeota archaeon]MBU0977205.1 hypothetical protein [Nanoarchaeota archaeon]
MSQILNEKNVVCENVTIEGNPNKINWFDNGVLDKDTQWFVRSIKVATTGRDTMYEICYIDYSEVDFPVGYYDAVGLAAPEFEYPNLIVNASLYLDLDKTSRCVNIPSTEIHEMLHILGFGHTFEVEDAAYWSDAKLGAALEDIMSPYTSCVHQKELNQKYVDCLKAIYSSGEVKTACNGVNLDLSTEDDWECPDGTYPTVGGEYCCEEPEMYPTVDGYCCPEPGMRAEGDYCVY